MAAKKDVIAANEREHSVASQPAAAPGQKQTSAKDEKHPTQQHDPKENWDRRISSSGSTRSVAVTYKPPMLVPRARLPAGAFCDGASDEWQGAAATHSGCQILSTRPASCIESLKQKPYLAPWPNG